MAALAVSLVAAAPSSAISGWEYVSADSANNSLNGKSATATCPAGKRVVGAGGAIFSGGQVVVDDLTPNAALTSVTVTGFEDDTGTDGSWFARAYAICGFPLAELLRVAVTSATSSSAFKWVTATCPGTRVLGTGAEITGGTGEVVIDDLTPNNSLTEVSVWAYEDDDGTSQSWSVRAYAICASPPVGLHRAVSVSPTNSLDKDLDATCSSGLRVHGVGADITGGVGNVRFSLIPVPVDGGLDRGYAGGREDENGTAADWYQRTYAICAE